jgi:hypothetical protein
MGGSLNKTTGAKTVKSAAGSTIATGTDADDGTTYTKGKWS